MQKCNAVDAHIREGYAVSVATNGNPFLGHRGMMYGWSSWFTDDFNYICLVRADISVGSKPELSTSSWLWELTALTDAGNVQLKIFRMDKELLTCSAIMPSTWEWSWKGNAVSTQTPFTKSPCPSLQSKANQRWIDGWYVRWLSYRELGEKIDINFHLCAFKPLFQKVISLA